MVVERGSYFFQKSYSQLAIQKAFSHILFFVFMFSRRINPAQKPPKAVEHCSLLFSLVESSVEFGQIIEVAEYFEIGVGTQKKLRGTPGLVERKEYICFERINQKISF